MTRGASTDLDGPIEQLYEGSWNGDLQRFRSHAHATGPTGAESIWHRLAVAWCVNFVEAHKLLPRRLRTVLEREHSDTLTAEMLSGFDGLSRWLGRYYLPVDRQ